MKLTLLDAEPHLMRVACADDITVFDLTGTENPLDAILGSAAGYGATVLLDLAKSCYIDSSGVGWLLQCHGRCKQAGGRLIIHSIAPMVNHCFRVLGMYQVLEIVADEAAVRKLVETTQAAST